MKPINLDERVRNGADASQLLGNRMLKLALEKVRDDLDGKAQSIPATDVHACQDLIRSRQILAAFERSIMGFVRDGQMAQAHIDAMAKRSTPLQRVFRR